MFRVTRAIVAGCCVLALAVGTASAQVDLPDERNDIFDELSTRIQQSADMATESEVLRLLDLGQDLGRNFAAGLALKTYLRRQPSVSPRLLRVYAESGGGAGAVVSDYVGCGVLVVAGESLGCRQFNCCRWASVNNARPPALEAGAPPPAPPSGVGGNGA